MSASLRRGLTLVDGMVVLATAGVLVAIAVNHFERYHIRSKQSEAKTVLGGIRVSQEGFRLEYERYCEAEPRPAGAPNASKRAWGAEGTCPDACDRNAPDITACHRWECMGYRPAGDVYFRYDVHTPQHVLPPDYTVSAESDLDGDGAFGLWAYGTDHEQQMPGGTARNAPSPGPCRARRGLVANEIINCEPDQY